MSIAFRKDRRRRRAAAVVVISGNFQRVICLFQTQCPGMVTAKFM